MVGLRKLQNPPAGKAAAAFGDAALQISLISPWSISCSVSILFPEVCLGSSLGKNLELASATCVCPRPAVADLLRATVEISFSEILRALRAAARFLVTPFLEAPL